MNNRAYKEVRATLRTEPEDTFVIIAFGKLQGYAPSLERACSLLKREASCGGKDFEARAFDEAVFMLSEP